MAESHTISKVGKRGTVVIPASLRKDFGIKEGSIVIAEKLSNGVLIRPAIALPIQAYSTKQKAEFLLSNSVDESDYLKAKQAVIDMGLDPNTIKHSKP